MMINTRLMYIENSLSDFNIASIIEKIDLVLFKSIYFEKLNQKISLYSARGQSILIGREVAGREEDLYSHESVKIKDFSAHELEKILIEYNDFSDLVQKSEKQKQALNKENFRIQIDLDQFNQAEVYFFNNREK